MITLGKELLEVSSAGGYLKRYYLVADAQNGIDELYNTTMIMGGLNMPPVYIMREILIDVVFEYDY